MAPQPESGGRAVLSILWTLTMAGFLVFAATDFAGLAASPTFIVPGILGIQSGSTLNSGMDFEGQWTNHTWGPASSLTYESAGGNPGGYLETTLFQSGSRGYWMQAFQVDGSTPYSGSVRLDVDVSAGLSRGYLFVFVDSSNGDPAPSTAVAAVEFGGRSGWRTHGPFRVNAPGADQRLTGPGTYYLKIGFVANATSGPVTVGLDNVQLRWLTDAGVVFYLPLPAPIVVVASQDKALFLSYYALLFGGLFAIGGYHLIRERKEMRNAFRAPIEAIGSRLRARSAWIAVAQVWMAITFVQIVVILLLPLVGTEPTSPIEIGPANVWVILYELANAGVYEELAFRCLLIGVPMAIGSAVVRIMEVNRGTTGEVPLSAGRYIAKSWRYLFGGVLRRESPKEAHVAAWAFLFASAAIFGLAHLPGWGWWKVFPTFVAGLGFGYLFLRHGLGAAILAHFVNDYALGLAFEGIGGAAVEAFITVLFLGLTIAGAGFLVWYAIDAVRHLTSLIHAFRPPRRMPAAPRPPAPFAVPPTPIAAPPANFPSTPTPYPAPTAARPDPAFGTWPDSPPAAPAVAPARDPTRVPRDYTPSYVPPPYGYPPVRFQCPSCGWVEARYDAGRFTCTRCGRTA